MGDVSAATTTHSVVFFFYLRYTVEELYSVYQHVTPDGMYYFGATQNVERRWRNNGAGYKRTALQPKHLKGDGKKEKDMLTAQTIIFTTP